MALLYIFSVYLLLILVCGNPTNDITQSGGKQFSFAFFPDSPFNPTSAYRNFLYFSSGSNGTCNVSYVQYAYREEVTVVVSGHNVTEEVLPDNSQLQSDIDTGVSIKAIYVNCDVDVDLYAVNKFQTNGQSSTAFMVLSDDNLSTDYILASIDRASFLGVVATANNTHVVVYIKSPCRYYFQEEWYKNGTLNVTLNHGEVLRIGDSIFKNNLCDLAGTRIHSSKRVAVFSGSFLYEDGRYYTDNPGHLAFQVPPISTFPYDVIVPGYDISYTDKMVVRVVGNHPQTKVQITSSLGGLDNYVISEGNIVQKEYHRPYVNLVIKSNYPVLVTQFIIADHERAGSLMSIPGINQYGNHYLVKTFHIDYTPVTAYLTFVAKRSSTQDVRVNGVYPSDLTWDWIYPSDYSVATMSNITRGTALNVTNSSPFLLRVTDYNGDMEFYSYFAGYKSEATDIQSSDYEVSFFKNASFIEVIDGSVVSTKADQPVYVQVDSLRGQGDVLLVQSCDVHFSDDMSLSYPLIEYGCTNADISQLLESQEHLTRFQFSVPRDARVFLTCSVSFCQHESDCIPGCQTDNKGSLVG